MVPSPPPSDGPLSATAITAVLDWWRDAGVDLDFSDAPAVWLPAAQPAGGPAAPMSAQRAEPAGEAPPSALPLCDAAALPPTLAEFHAWWLAEPALDDGQVRNRVSPRGPVGAELMIVVAQPEAEDSAALLSGREGRLLAALLTAGGMQPAQVYFASALPRHRPLPDWDGLSARGLGLILAHHIRLVAPRRLLVCGSHIPPLLGHGTTQNAQTLIGFNHGEPSVSVLAVRELGALLARPAWKAGLWRQWLDWTGSNTT